MQTKKIPVRMCTGCAQHKPKKMLIRVVRGPDGQISLDMTGKKPGRGAYLCRDVECLKKARRSKKIERVLECQIPPELYDRMEEEIIAGTT